MKKHKKTEIYMVYVCDTCRQEDRDKKLMAEHEEICKKYSGQRVRQVKHSYPQPEVPIGTLGTCNIVDGRFGRVSWDNGVRERYCLSIDPLEIVETGQSRAIAVHVPTKGGAVLKRK